MSFELPLVPKIQAVKVLFFFFQLCRLVFLEPMGVQRHTVPHFKGLIELYLDLQAQGRDSIFTFCHAQLKKVQVAGLF